jgi:pimeloyl-ACP methyl ester carboxylesterase
MAADGKPSAAGPLIDIKSPLDATVLGSIRAPTLVAHSREDWSVDFANAECSAGTIKSASLFVSPTWSHFPWFGPGGDDELNAVLRFFKEHEN